MYIARTLKELYDAVSRDEHEIKMMDEAMKEYEKFGERIVSAGLCAGIGGVGTGVLAGLLLGGPIGVGIGAVAGLAMGASHNKSLKKEEDKHFKKSDCNGLREKINRYYKETSVGNSYITITHI